MKIFCEQLPKFIKMTGSVKVYIKRHIFNIGQRLCEIVKRMGIGINGHGILFVAESQLMVSYLKEIWQRLQDDDRLRLRVTFDNEIDPQIIADVIVSFQNSGNKIRRIHYWAAMLWPWDLIVFADCTTAWKLFHKTSRKLKIEHGINAGKLSRSGKQTDWAEWLWKNDGTPAFDMIFVTSVKNKILGEGRCPAYRGKIACVGNLRFDNLLEACRKHSKIKKELCIIEGKKVILVVSSWGPSSLLHTFGRQLYRECSNLADKYHFIITAHPNNYDRDKTWIDLLQQQSRWGATVLRSSEDYTDFMAVADVLVTDFTSMSLYFVPLIRPIVSIPIPKDLGEQGSAMYRMESIATRISSPERLKDALETAISSGIQEKHKLFADELVSYQGRAWIEMKKWIYKLLLLNESESISVQTKK
jgi:hypothetical protein